MPWLCVFPIWVQLPFRETVGGMWAKDRLLQPHLGFLDGSVAKDPSAVQEMQETWFSHWWGRFPGGRAWKPSPEFLPGKSHGQRNLVGYSSWGCKETDTSEVTEHMDMHPHAGCHDHHRLLPQSFSIASLWSFLASSSPPPHRQEDFCACWLSHLRTLISWLKAELHTANSLPLLWAPQCLPYLALAARHGQFLVYPCEIFEDWVCAQFTLDSPGSGTGHATVLNKSLWDECINQPTFQLWVATCYWSLGTCVIANFFLENLEVFKLGNHALSSFPFNYLCKLKVFIPW